MFWFLLFRFRRTYRIRLCLILLFIYLFIYFVRENRAYEFYSRLSLNGHLCKTDTSLKRTPTVGPCLSLLPLFDSLKDGHLSKTDTYCRSQRCPSKRELTVLPFQLRLSRQWRQFFACALTSSVSFASPYLKYCDDTLLFFFLFPDSFRQCRR